MQTILQSWCDRLDRLTVRMEQLSITHSAWRSAEREAFNTMYQCWNRWRCRIVAVARRNQYRVDLKSIIGSLEDNRLVMDKVQRSMTL